MAALATAMAAEPAHLVVTAASSMSKGRAAYATEDTPAGALVWKEGAFACLPRAAACNTVCWACMKVHRGAAQLSTSCKHCKKVCYCNARCRNNDSEFHENVCLALTLIPSLAQKFIIDEEILQMLVVILARAQSPAAGAGMFRANMGHVLELVSHKEKLSAKFSADIVTCFKELQAATGAIKANSHGDVDGLTFGLFPGLAMLCHSCRPNCMYSVEGGVAVVRTCEPVAKGAELTISYLSDLGMSRRRRREHLMTERFFVCSCSRCEKDAASGAGADPFEAFRCDQAGCAGLVPVNLDDSSDDARKQVFSCNVCGHGRPFAHFERCVDEELGPCLAALATAFYGGDGGCAALCRAVSAARERVGMHEHHEMLYASYPLMSQACEAEGDVAQASLYARARLGAVEVFAPQFSPEKMQLHLRIAMLSERQAATQVPAMPPALWERVRANLVDTALQHRSAVAQHADALGIRPPASQ